MIRVGVDYKSPITITVPIKLSITITITITVVIEKAITITITIIRLRLRLQLLVYHGYDSRLFIRHVHLGRVHTCSGREPDSSVLGARVPFASTRAKNRPAAIPSRPVKLKLRVHTATGTVPGLA